MTNLSPKFLSFWNSNYFWLTHIPNKAEIEEKANQDDILNDLIGVDDKPQDMSHGLKEEEIADAIDDDEEEKIDTSKPPNTVNPKPNQK
jgi:hypothetical protein